MNVYEIDTLAEFSGNFVVFGTTTPVDPTDINLFVRDPMGAIIEYTYPANITRVSEGVYTAMLVLNRAGVWIYKWQGTGSAEVSSPDTVLQVNQTVFQLSP